VTNDVMISVVAPKQELNISGLALLSCIYIGDYPLLCVSPLTAIAISIKSLKLKVAFLSPMLNSSFTNKK